MCFNSKKTQEKECKTSRRDQSLKLLSASSVPDPENTLQQNRLTFPKLFDIAESAGRRENRQEEEIAVGEEKVLTALERVVLNSLARSNAVLCLRP